jgi:hypothetical protein
MFWALNMKLIGTNEIKEMGGVAIGNQEVKKIPEDALNKHDKKPEGFMGKLRDLVKKAIDCCIE